MVQQGPERVDVRPWTDDPDAAGLFGCGVGGGAEQLAREGEVGCGSGRAFGEAEVRDARLVEGVDEDVGRLEVAMKDPCR